MEEIKVPLLFEIENNKQDEIPPFDKSSLELFHSFVHKHETAEALSKEVLHLSNDLKTLIKGRHISLNSGMNYEQMIKCFVPNDEIIYLINDKPLFYTSITIDYNPQFFNKKQKNNSPSFTTTYNGGISILTNKKLIFMSCSDNEVAKLEPFKNPKIPPGGYNVKFQKEDFIWYRPISISCIKSVEMYAVRKTSSEQLVNGIGGCCCIPKIWKRGLYYHSSVNERKIILGILMPPWNMKTTVCMEIFPNVPLIDIQNFIATLQKLCNF